eukprot:1525368-Amphidinium_carterae.1
MDTQRDGRLLASLDISTEMENSGPLAAEPGLPAVQLESVPGLPATLPPSDSASGGFAPAPVPEVGEEIADLGWELGTALVLRRTAERRSFFARRGSPGPDDSPFADCVFDHHREYRGEAWGSPVPQEEWERRVYVELNLATDLRYEGKGARPECHACRVRGSREVPLAKCIICENWACLRHLA